MANDLIERDEALGRVRRALDEASAGRGSIVVVTGEAGHVAAILGKLGAANRRDGPLDIQRPLREPVPRPDQGTGGAGRQARAGRRYAREVRGEQVARQQPLRRAGVVESGPEKQRPACRFAARLELAG